MAPTFRDAETATGPSAVLDDAQLEMVRAILSEAAFADFLEACKVQIAKHSRELDAGPHSAERLAHLAHAMIGSAGAMGALKVLAIARRLENACEIESEQVRDRLTARLLAAWSEADGELGRLRATCH